MPDDFALPGYDLWKTSPPEWMRPEPACDDCGGLTRCHCDDLYDQMKDREMEDRDEGRYGEPDSDERSNPRWDQD